MLAFISDKKEALVELCKKYSIQTMHVFGSATTQKFDDSSDVDILISFKELSVSQYTDNYFNLHEKLEQLFNRKVDLLTERSLSNPFFIQSIEETKQLLYAA